MTKLSSLGKRFMIGLIVLLQVFFYPAAGFAQETDTLPAENEPATQQQVQEEQPSQPETPPLAEEKEQQVQQPSSNQEQPQQQQAPAPQTAKAPIYGPDRPNGAAADTFTYNPKTGLWENDYYTWDQATQTTKPKKEPVYTYNPKTGLWESVQWLYQAHLGKYMPFIVTFDHNPSPSAARTASLAGTGSGSNNTINSSGNTTGIYGNYTTIGITNYITATAFTGDATVYQNTVGGSAKSGDALTAANLLNLLQSSWSPYTATFEVNIDGNVVGDLNIDTTGPNSNNNINVNNNTNLQTNISTDVDITNNVDLVAKSGNATVEANTKAGDATSGNADVMINIINLLNSMINTGQSFVGTININGDFEGDILLPESMLQYLLANTGPNSTNNVDNSSTNTLNVTATDTTSINNNLTLDAHSGDASVTGNTSAGNAKSGSANTSITILNLTGKNIVAENAVLVFINVQGKWIGAIVNAPEGSTAAALAGTGPGSTNNVSISNNTNRDVNVNSDLTINNNIKGEAGTGDAAVKDNTEAGNATSGNANVNANIANLSGTNLNLSKWFGVLFINVFGTWKGSFGINTAFGNQVASAGSGTATAAATSAATTAAPSSTPKPFAFIPGVPSGNAPATTQDNAAQAVAGATSDAPANNNPTVASTNPGRSVNTWVAVGGVAFAFSLLGLERYLTFRRR